MPKILLVEDEKVIRDAFTILLEAQSYDVQTAANGKVALELCKENNYDIILLDIMMPVLDGVGFLKQINPRVSLPHTRVIILSNLSSGEDLSQALDLGAHRQEVKSNLSPKDLLAVVEDELAAAK